MHDKGGIAESLYVYIKRAGVNTPTPSLRNYLSLLPMAIFWRFLISCGQEWKWGTRLHVDSSSLSCTGGISAYQPHGTLSLLIWVPCCLSHIVHHSKREHFDVPQAPSSFQLFVLIMASWAGPEEEDTVTYVRKDTRPSPSIWFNLLLPLIEIRKLAFSLAPSSC